MPAANIALKFAGESLHKSFPIKSLYVAGLAVCLVVFIMLLLNGSRVISIVPISLIFTFERNEKGLTVSLAERTSDELTFANVIKILS